MTEDPGHIGRMGLVEQLQQMGNSAAAVNILVTDPMRNTVSGVAGLRVVLSATPKPAFQMILLRSTITSAAPGTPASCC